MERIIKIRKKTIPELLKGIGAGNSLHVSLRAYPRMAIVMECSRQNKAAGCTPFNRRYETSTQIKSGYITIYQRY